MIASVDRGFVLLCNPKTGTTALEAAFARYAEIRLGGNPGLKHLKYTEMKEMFGTYFEKRNCRIYAVVRDPVDTLASWYRYRARDQLADPRHPNHGNYTGHMPFSQFVRDWAAQPPPTWARVPSPVGWCRVRPGTLAPLRYFRYENIDALVEVLSEHVGERPQVPRANVSPPRPLDMDREEVARLPKMQVAYASYARIPFVA